MSNAVERDLADLFNAQPREHVHWEAAPGYLAADIVPDANDDLRAVLAKAKIWKRIVEEGYSLAASFGMLGRDAKAVNPEGSALETMTPSQKKQYSAWRSGVKPPALDLERDRRATTKGVGAEKRWKDRADALKVIYKVDDMLPEHAAHFFHTYPGLADLVQAVVAVIKSARDASGGSGRNPREVKEDQAASWAVRVASTVVKDYKEEINRITREIDYEMGHVQARRRAVAPEESNRSKKKAPINTTRELLGEKVIGKPTSYEPAGASGRRSRTAMRGVGPAIMGGGRRGPPPGAAGPSGFRGTTPERRPPSPVYRPQSPPPVSPVTPTTLARFGEIDLSTVFRAGVAREDDENSEGTSTSFGKRKRLESGGGGMTTRFGGGRGRGGKGKDGGNAGGAGGDKGSSMVL